MNRSRLLLVVAAVLAGTGAVLAIAGIATNPVFVVLSLPFGAAAYVMWADATGRRRFRWRRAARRVGSHRGDATRGQRPGQSRRARRFRTAGGSGRHRRRRSEATPAAGGMSPRDARQVLGVDDDADDAAIRRAYRERVTEVHPDTDGGDEEAFKRVTEARDRLLDE
ncbi:MAG: J domain-containing protein [Halanaeroarchaeum sp.]